MAADTTSQSSGSSEEDTLYKADEEIEDYTERRRVEAILDAQERVGSTHDKVYGHVLDGKLTRSEATAYYRRVVQHYITLVEPLMKRYDETGADYWHHKQIGAITIPPPDDLAQLEEDREVVVLDSLPEERFYPVVGLEQVLELPEAVEEEFSVRVRYPHTGAETKTATAVQPIPEQLLRKAFRLTNEFLSDVDLEVDLQGGEIDVHADPF